MRRQLRKIAGAWYLWLFPLFAILISAWLLADYYRQKGLPVRILFDDAAGIQAEKTTVRYRGVAIGVVKKVSISEDQRDVIVDVLLQKEAEDFAVEGSKFALVIPKVSFQGVTGLETIFEGTYISVIPGKGDRKTTFKAATNPQGVDPLDDTSAYLLEAASVESVNTGDAVTYRGLKVGSVTKLILAKDSQKVLVQINVENRYVKLIRSNTAFWRKVAVQAKLGLFGSEIKVNSLDTIMNGGIEIATPNNPGPIAKALTKFVLGANPPKDLDKWNPKLEY